MPKIKTALLVEESLMDRVRETAIRQSWTLTAATELAFELFLQKFEKAPDPAQLPTPAPVAEAEPVKETI
jgi:hypothetical protein